MKLLELPLQEGGTIHLDPLAITVIEPRLTGTAADRDRIEFSEVTLRGTDRKISIAMPPAALADLANEIIRAPAAEQPASLEFPYHPDAALFFELAGMHIRRSLPRVLDHIYGLAADGILPSSPCYERFQQLKTLLPESRQQNGYNADYVGAFTAIGMPPHLVQFLWYSDSADLSHDDEIRRLQAGLQEVQRFILRRCSSATAGASHSDANSAALPTPTTSNAARSR